MAEFKSRHSAPPMKFCVTIEKFPGLGTCIASSQTSKTTFKFLSSGAQYSSGDSLVLADYVHLVSENDAMNVILPLLRPISNLGLGRWHFAQSATALVSRNKTIRTALIGGLPVEMMIHVAHMVLALRVTGSFRQRPRIFSIDSQSMNFSLRVTFHDCSYGTVQFWFEWKAMTACNSLRRKRTREAAGEEGCGGSTSWPKTRSACTKKVAAKVWDESH
jgi:hypothetical protein